MAVTKTALSSQYFPLRALQAPSNKLSPDKQLCLRRQGNWEPENQLKFAQQARTPGELWKGQMNMIRVRKALRLIKEKVSKETRKPLYSFHSFWQRSERRRFICSNCTIARYGYAKWTYDVHIYIYIEHRNLETRKTLTTSLFRYETFYYLWV